jgi:(p)ppGpp synthase/HD superfamily hydrolase
MDGQPGPGWRKQPIRPLSVRFDEALVLASSLHRDQVRKASGVPYVSHLLAVASLVLDEGGSEDMAIAALLHDAAEDQLPKPQWEPRKRHHMAAIPMADPEARLIMLADKVHNARSIVADHARVGPEVWERFSVPRERTVWYYQSLLDVFERDLSPVLYDALHDCVRRMKELN